MNCNRMVGDSRSALNSAAIELLEPRALFSVDLTASLSLGFPPSGKVLPGGSIIFLLTVSNPGTTTAAGPLTANLSLSPNANGSSPVSLGSVTRRINLKAGVTTSFRVTEKVSGGVAPGTYFGVATVDPGNTFGESDTTNNTARSSNSFQVASKYPNATGNWGGTSSITAGTGKGTTYTITFSISNENQSNGTFSLSGTNHFPDGTTQPFSGTGKLTPAGTFTGATGGSGRVHGKVNGNTITFTFTNRRNSGSGSATLQG